MEKYKKLLGLFVLTVMLSSLMYFANINAFLYKASILDYPDHEPFDGTTYPIKKVPDWVHVDSDNWDLNYSSMSSSDLTSLPYYNPSQLKTPVEDLVWGNSSDDKIRNAKITYSVPYMGNYLLDGRENAGSHLAVDIKVPTGTPVYAMANGTVIKAANQSSGFGNHIVLMHVNVPSLDDEDDKEILYSSYSHLSSILVDVGDVVEKGDQIALTGSTGTATTPHLHFQLDNDEAPWHPYWHFTWSEISAVGLDFFSAINEGFGKALALKTTVNPMKYVQEYMDYTQSSSYVADTSDPVEDDQEEDEDIEDDDEEEEEDDEPVQVEEEEEDNEELELTFQIETESTYFIGQTSQFVISVEDQYGDVFSSGFEGHIEVTSDKGKFASEKSLLKIFDFDSDHRLKVALRKMKEGRDRIVVTYNDEEYYSDWFNILDPNTEQLFSDVPSNNQNYEAISYLASEGVINGYNDQTFRPYNTVSRVEALKFILEGIDEKLYSGDLSFTDTKDNDWYADYLYTAKKKKFVAGYDDGTFKPGSVVNKAEFFKMLFNGMGEKVDEDVSEAPYSDVPVNSWFAPYISHAKELGIIDDDIVEFSPSDGMSRGEVAEAMYRLMTLD